MSNLIQTVENLRKEIRTDSYSMSIGELINLYESSEIDIHPEFQRFFRWTDTQKTRFIESLFLDIPVPPIFVSQRPNGVWDVVDGLQRLSTIFQFTGKLKNKEGGKVDLLQLKNPEYIESLEDISWEGGNVNKILPTKLKLQFKRSRINVSIILKESDPDAKYTLFQRLNTGGTNLTSQEIRNCSMIMIDNTFFEWVKKLASFLPFKSCTDLSEKSIDESYDTELVLRFLVFTLATEDEIRDMKDIGSYLDSKAIALAKDKNFNRDSFEILFKETFEMINNNLGGDAFKRYDANKVKFLGGFLVSAYEAISYGVAYNIKLSSLTDALMPSVINLWSNQEYIDSSGAGKNANQRVRKVTMLGRRIFGNND